MQLSDDKKTLLRIDITDIDANGHFRVPDGVVTIGDGNFQHSSVSDSLRSVDLNKAEILRSYVLSYCYLLESVTGSPKIIQNYAFYNDRALSEFNFSNVTELGSSAFNNTGLRKIDISNISHIPNAAFSHCSKLKEVIGAPKVIESDAFWKCRNITNFDFSKIERLAVDSFVGCGISRNIFENGKIMQIRYEKDKAEKNIMFAITPAGEMSYVIGGVIDENKNAYTDVQGNPFIIEAGSNERIMLSEDKERFLELWNAS